MQGQHQQLSDALLATASTTLLPSHPHRSELQRAPEWMPLSRRRCDAAPERGQGVCDLIERSRSDDGQHLAERCARAGLRLLFLATTLAGKIHIAVDGNPRGYEATVLVTANALRLVRFRRGVNRPNGAGIRTIFFGQSTCFVVGSLAAIALFWHRHFVVGSTNVREPHRADRSWSSHLCHGVLVLIAVTFPQPDR